MINCYLRIVLVPAFCAAIPTSLAGQATYKVIAQLNSVGSPSRLFEGSPGLFYSAGSQLPTAAFSITSQGRITVLVTFTTSGAIIQSPLMGGANGRVYSAVEVSTNPSNVFSVTSAPGKTVYETQTILPLFTQNLPDQTLLGVGFDATGGQYLMRCSLNGTVTSFYQFPAGVFLPITAVYAVDGNYYGVAVDAQGADYLYRVTPGGTETTLYNFSPTNSFGPGPSLVPLLQATDGNLYGATPIGGAKGTGSIYKFSLKGKGQYTLIYSFPSNYVSSGPDTLMEGSDGAFYGAAGQHLFRVTKSGQYSVLYTPKLYPEGSGPFFMTQGSDGNIYGVAGTGGAYGSGTVFVLSAGLPKPPPWLRQFRPDSGSAGARVLLWGSNLLSASVSFNGVPATTVSNSGSNYVWATVPAGAISGPITVSTPGGTSTSKAEFTVK